MSSWTSRWLSPGAFGTSGQTYTINGEPATKAEWDAFWAATAQRQKEREEAARAQRDRVAAFREKMEKPSVGNLSGADLERTRRQAVQLQRYRRALFSGDQKKQAISQIDRPRLAASLAPVQKYKVLNRFQNANKPRYYGAVQKQQNQSQTQPQSLFSDNPLNIGG